MTIGWIKLHRLLLEKEIFQDAYVLKTFIYLLLKAAYKETSIRVGNRSIELAPGQLLYGRQRVSQRLNIGEGKLRGIMNYLVQKGSIEIEAHSKYSIVTIANWEQYQKGDGEPDFPFDVDFLDDDEDEEPAEAELKMAEKQIAEAEPVEENVVEQKPSRTSRIDPFEISWDGYKDWKEESYGEEFWNRVWGKDMLAKSKEDAVKTEPAENQMPMQSEIDFQDLDDDFSANREPQYNNINKYKNNNIIKNKTRENNNKTKEEHQILKNIANIQNTENMKNISYRQSCSVDDEPARISALDIAERVAGQDTSQEMLLSGGVVSKGKGESGGAAETVDVDFSSEALNGLTMMDDAALDAYFASCEFADFGSVGFSTQKNTDNADWPLTVHKPSPYEPDDAFEPIPLDDTDLPVQLRTDCRPGHDFTAEMRYSMTQQDIEQLGALLSAQSRW